MLTVVIFIYLNLSKIFCGLMKRLRKFLATLCWIIAFSSVILQALYARPKISLLDVTLIFIVGCFAGFVIRDFRSLIECFLAMILGSVGFILFCLNLPSIVGGLLSSQLLQYSSIVRVFQGMFPLPLIASLMGAMLGKILKEMFLSLS